MSAPGDATLDAARALLAQARWLALATVGDAGEPAASYVPFAPVAGALGIVVSALAAHTAQLSARPRASVLLVAGAAAEADPYARPRLTLDVTARAAHGAEAERVWDALAARNGPTVAVLRSLPDFRAFRLEPLRGRAILGFAQAATLEGEVLARLLMP